MVGNSYGNIFRITTYGESHGKSIGVLIDGCPSGLELDLKAIQHELNRRKPGQSEIVTQRKESDEFEIRSGVFEGVTTGHPILMDILNTNTKSQDYDHIKDSYRPSHADFTYQDKYGIRDYRGGGRSSARETAARVAAGGIAKQLLVKEGIQINGYVSQVGPLKLGTDYKLLDLESAENNIVRCPDANLAEEMKAYIKECRSQGDTVGGVVSCVVSGMKSGLGEPVFDRLDADLAKAMLSINASKGFEYGSGFEGVSMKGSKHNDPFYIEDGVVKTTTNHSGGIQGGISNGMDVYFKVAFKPVATIMQDQESIDKEGNTVTVSGKGRHDPCVVPRAVAIVEAMAALVLIDKVLMKKAYK